MLQYRIEIKTFSFLEMNKYFIILLIINQKNIFFSKKQHLYILSYKNKRLLNTEERYK